MWINLLPLLRLRFVIPNTGNWLIGVEYNKIKLLNFSLANKKRVVEFQLSHLITLWRNLGTSLSLSNSLFVSREKKKFEVVPISLIFSLLFSSPVERLQSLVQFCIILVFWGLREKAIV